MGKISKKLAQKILMFFNNANKLIFLFIECINERLLCQKSTFNIYKTNKPFLVSSCFSMRDLMSN